MKTYPQALLITAALCIAALNSPARVETNAAVSTPPAAPVATADPDAVSAPWSAIKADTYDQREHFSAGVSQLEARVAAQIAELNAKRTLMNSNNTDLKAWDFAMKEMADSHAYLRAMGEEAAKATRENWEQKREKVGQAWLRTQDAYGKVKASTTT